MVLVAEVVYLQSPTSAHRCAAGGFDFLFLEPADKFFSPHFFTPVFPPMLGHLLQKTWDQFSQFRS